MSSSNKIERVNVGSSSSSQTSSSPFNKRQNHGSSSSSSSLLPHPPLPPSSSFPQSDIKVALLSADDYAHKVLSDGKDVDIKASDLGRFGSILEGSSVEFCAARVLIEGHERSQIKFRLVHSTTPDADTDCDADSQDDRFHALFSSSGRLKSLALKSLPSPPKEMVYFEENPVEKGNADQNAITSDHAATAIFELLKSTALADAWEIALYIPNSLDGDPNHDAIPFFACGFRQIEAGDLKCALLMATPATLQLSLPAKDPYPPLILPSNVAPIPSSPTDLDSDDEPRQCCNCDCRFTTVQSTFSQDPTVGFICSKCYSKDTLCQECIHDEGFFFCEGCERGFCDPCGKMKICDECLSIYCSKCGDLKPRKGGDKICISCQPWWQKNKPASAFCVTCGSQRQGHINCKVCRDRICEDCPYLGCSCGKIAVCEQCDWPPGLDHCKSCEEIHCPKCACSKSNSSDSDDY